ncbi:hypothetical protein QBC40DRAFT_336097 [Triangularia verruculosa]|uniref:Protein kinase domain-containing protein n=1 Tax=Triangularia verruculosa TaxID=2587418 RepID=A0AAN7AXV3_9PEZI|nr:hypothetical protein QBC40DRAFT_336097 [Triangularia verruculosa]
MRCFQDAGFHDECLPVARYDKKQSSSTTQHHLLAPVFEVATSTQYNYDLNADAILPFTERDQLATQSGSFGRVFKYKIHENHLIDPQNVIRTRPYVAVKELQPNNEDGQKLVQGWGQEASVLQKMNALNHEHIVRFLTAFRRGETGLEDHYLMFEWADGGNLRTLWETTSQPLTPTLLKAAVNQLAGLADALDKAHNPVSGPMFRHGDLKPENILWFKSDDQIGTLKIADWGLARQHNIVTELRNSRTSTQHGTRTYEPPEEETGLGITVRGLAPGDAPLGKRRSRLYDIWAMGCITLEFIIWLMYGERGRKVFHKQLKGNSELTLFYQTTSQRRDRKVARVHDIAIKWMDHIARDPRCKPDGTALGDLLELVRERLLVVELPSNLGSFSDLVLPSSASVYSRRSSVNTIASEVVMSPNSNTPMITFTEALPTSAPTIIVHSESVVALDLRSSYETVVSTPSQTPQASHGGRALAREFSTRMSHIQYEEDGPYWIIDHPEAKPPPLDKSPTSPPEAFPAADAEIESRSLLVPPIERVDYGSQSLDNDWKITTDNTFATEFFEEIYNLVEVEEAYRDLSCDLCGLIWQAFTLLEAEQKQKSDTLLMQRTGNRLTLNELSDLTFNIFRSHDLDIPTKDEIPVGYTSTLPALGSALHFAHLQQWLENCDRHHSNCKPNSTPSGPSSSSTRSLPTRVIDVGSTGKWLALSHQWGSPPHFCTTPDNLASHLSSIPFPSGLPATFRDAVTVTRALGVQYLWIDSLCIIQGPSGDFKSEAKKMEQVYSGAYCVLAVSREEGGHSAGFLQPRKRERNHVTLSKPGDEDGKQGVFSFCEPIDDFNGDVLQGPLNQRGWVLQEHALARRTIFYTEKQTYWECGEGVMCESMMRMRNTFAAFLGDPNFPQLLSHVPQGEKIVRYQNLYASYSHLSLTSSFDRPLAIDGLQDRILSALGAKGGFGVFDEGTNKKGLLRRSLLWVRSKKTNRLTKIKFGVEQAISFVPSWSWMAYEGGIGYITVPFGEVDWEDLTSPWSGSVQKTSPRSGERGAVGQAVITADAFDYDTIKVGNEEWRVEMDIPGGSQQQETKCVVLGRSNSMGLGERRCYPIFVRQVSVSGLKQMGNAERVYERVGAGYLPEACVYGNAVTVMIC